MTHDSFIQISVLLAASHRGAVLKEQVERACVQLGMDVLSVGTSSLCCQVTARQFEKLFGVSAPHSIRSGRGTESPRGFVEPVKLPVPTLLQESVEAISIEPPPQLMS